MANRLRTYLIENLVVYKKWQPFRFHVKFVNDLLCLVDQCDVISMIPSSFQCDVISMIPSPFQFDVISMIPSPFQFDVISMIPSSFQCDVISMIPSRSTTITPSEVKSSAVQFLEGTLACLEKTWVASSPKRTPLHSPIPPRIADACSTASVSPTNWRKNGTESKHTTRPSATRVSQVRPSSLPALQVSEVQDLAQSQPDQQRDQPLSSPHMISTPMGAALSALFEDQQTPDSALKNPMVQSSNVYIKSVTLCQLDGKDDNFSGGVKVSQTRCWFISCQWRYNGDQEAILSPIATCKLTGSNSAGYLQVAIGQV
uniref:Uncharacterized protein n=1 Tax=Timema poppense TaxID=170557 RepID=A0A7R9CTP2_TIMPO|nr:unnamed protein product [Timema poppensis]